MSELQEATKEFLIESHENLDQLDTDLVGLEKVGGARGSLGPDLSHAPHHQGELLRSSASLTWRRWPTPARTSSASCATASWPEPGRHRGAAADGGRHSPDARQHRKRRERRRRGREGLSSTCCTDSPLGRSRTAAGPIVVTVRPDGSSPPRLDFSLAEGAPSNRASPGRRRRPFRLRRRERHPKRPRRTGPRSMTPQSASTSTCWTS